MNAPAALLAAESRLPTELWPSRGQVPVKVRPAPRFSRSPTNLYELFVRELSLLASGASHADRVAKSFFYAIPAERIRLRSIALGLAQSARASQPLLPAALSDQGVVLPPVRAVVIESLLRPLAPDRRGRVELEPCNMMGACAVGALTHVALHFSAALGEAAENARLLGSERLVHALSAWAAAWEVYLHDLRLQARRYRAQAYAADFETSPLWQTA